MSGRPVSTFARLRNGYPFDSADFAGSGDLPLVRIRDLANDPFETFIDPELAPMTALIDDGQVIIGMDGDFNVRLWDRGPAALNQRLCVLDAKWDTDARFLAYALPAKLRAINDLTYATTVKHLSSQQVLHLRLPNIGRESQVRIADFLDHETALIDAMIENQRELVERLVERRRTIMSGEALPHVGSGHRLKWVLAEQDRRAGPETDLPLMSVSIEWGLRRRDEVAISQAASEDLSRYKVVRAGDIVLNRMRAFQGALGLAPEDGLVSPDYAVYRVSDSVSSEWLADLMRSDVFVSQMASRIRGIGTTDSGQVRTPRINTSDLFQILVDVPERKVQDTELRSWRKERHATDCLITAANESIALMQERRSALITEAVTGRIDPYTGRETTLTTQEQ